MLRPARLYSRWLNLFVTRRNRCMRKNAQIVEWRVAEIILRKGALADNKLQEFVEISVAHDLSLR